MNNEFEVLYDFLDKLPGVLKPGGKLQSSHSIRRTNLVKEIIQTMEKRRDCTVRSQKRRHPTVKKNASAKPCEMHENALGNPGRRVKIQNKTKRRKADKE